MFHDRQEGGRRLGEHLARVLDPGAAPIVLGIPRGGVVVAGLVAEALQAPLDVVVPRKIGAPANPELAVGALALADGEDLTVLDQASLAWLRVPAGYLQDEVARQRQEILRRVEAYRQGRPAAPLDGRTAVIVDDGIATGLTARAAVAAISRLGPREVVLAAPIAAPSTVRELVARGIRVEALETPSPFQAVGRFYAEFGAVEDDEVCAVLAAHAPR